jgi:hypothetical protein
LGSAASVGQENHEVLKVVKTFTFFTSFMFRAAAIVDENEP